VDVANSIAVLVRQSSNLRKKCKERQNSARSILLCARKIEEVEIWREIMSNVLPCDVIEVRLVYELLPISTGYKYIESVSTCLHAR